MKIYQQILLLLLFLGFNMSLLNAQKIAKNNRGETIVQFEDGSWRYFDEDDPEDQVLMEAYLLEQQKDASASLNPMVDAKIDEEKAKIEREEKARQEAIRRADAALAEEEQAYQKLNEIIIQREKLENRLKKLRKKKASTDVIAQLNEEMLYLSKKELKASEQMDAAAAKARLYEKMIYMSKKKRDRLLAKLEEEQTNETPNTTADVTSAIKQQAKAPTPVQVNTSSKKRTDFIQLKAEDNMMLNPPLPDCEIVFDGVDEFSGKNRRDTATKYFFEHTDERLRPVFGDQSFIECHGHMTAVSGGFKFLSIEVVINDINAQRTYGFIEKGSMLSLKLVDGTNVQLINNNTDRGSLDQLNERVIYKAQYMIGPDLEKELLKMEIDRVRLVWSTGYEDYEIFETDFMMHQLSCLNDR